MLTVKFIVRLLNSHCNASSEKTSSFQLHDLRKAAKFSTSQINYANNAQKHIIGTPFRNTEFRIRFYARLLWPNNSNIKSIISFRMKHFNFVLLFPRRLIFVSYFSEQTQLHQLIYVWIHLKWNTARFQKEKKYSNKNRMKNYAITFSVFIFQVKVT